MTINELYDLDKTIAKDVFSGVTYPWEVLSRIKEYIIKLGNELSPEEYDNPMENVWISKKFYGIDKGITLCMLENYKSGLIWKLFTNHPYIQKGISKLGFIKK